MVKPRWDLPAPNYEANVNTSVRIYRKAIQQVLTILSEMATQGQADKAISNAQMNSVLNQLSILLSEVDRESEAFVKAEIKKAFKDGQAETLIALGDAKTLEEAAAIASMSELSTQTIDSMVADTFEDLFYANNKMKRETIKMVRSLVSENMKVSSAMGQGKNFTKKMILDAFEKQGNIAIVDQRGRKWKLDTYAEMVTRTKMHEAHTEGVRVEALERGVDLGIISNHNAKDSCGKFEGQIISMNGQTEGFMTYEDLRRSNLIFHPNCKHRVTPIRDISILPEAIRDKFEKGQAEAKKALKSQKSKK